MIRHYYIVSILIIVAAIGIFVWSFEKRKPKTREIVTLGVLTGMAIVGRVIFFMTPQFKPCAAIIIITGIMLGKQSGFLCGCLTAFISDFFFGQGPWTPWQMFSFGLLGFISGLLARKGILTEKRPLIDAVIGFLLMVLVVGPILDTCAIFTMAQMINTESVLAVYLAGLPVNISQGTAVFLCVLLLTRPMMNKLERIKIKYGMIEQ